MALTILLLFGLAHLFLARREGIWAGFRFEPGLGWLPKANLVNAPVAGAFRSYLVSTDSNGYRNSKEWAEGAEVPVLLQGDSNAFGFGLEQADTFCERWQKDGGPPCFNAGVPGYDLQQYFYQGRRLLEKYRVRHRLVLFNLGNDFSHSALESPYLIPRPYLFQGANNEAAEGILPQQPFLKQVYGDHFIEPLRTYDAQIAWLHPGRDWGRWLPASLARIHLLTFVMEVVYPRIYYFLFGGASGQAVQLELESPSWQLTPIAMWPEPFARFLPHFSRLLREVGSQPAGKKWLLLFPMRSQVIPEEREFAVEKLKEVNLQALNQLMIKAGEAAGFRVLDATPLFQANKNPRSLYQEDSHLSKEGVALLVKMARELMGKDPG